MTLQQQMTHAAETILTQCLNLPSGAEIIIFADETTMDTANILAEAALKLELEAIVAYYSSPMQMALGSRGLAPKLQAALHEAAAALICLNGTPECLPFRNYVRQTGWNPNCKVAHMPGVSQSTLLLADVDYETLEIQCEMLALALAKGRQIEISSWDQQGREYSLKAALDPWARLPIISDGIIQPGSWGNVPSGETYIAPLEGSAEGQIVINGSIPGYRISPAEEIILHFKQGRLVDWTPAASLAGQRLQKTQIEFARSHGDQNWANLAEIGLGANPRVQELTGNPLLDEKKYGTVHIALGNNIDMGGETKSLIHCDMVCLSPRLSIDGKLVMEGNEIVLQPQDWCEDYQEIEPPTAWHSEICVKYSAVNAHTDAKGRLKRLWDTSSGRVCSVPVGNDRTAQSAAAVYQLIQNAGPVSLNNLNRETHRFTHKQLLQLTYVLKLYGLINVYENDYN
ncbi:MAG: aminopeptidase [Anaerolineaceae bacterium]|nr:aminopeptidase [Anaerolineaceae bacterium]